MLFETRLALNARRDASRAAFSALDKAAASEPGRAMGRREFAKTAMRRSYWFAVARAERTWRRSEREIAKACAAIDAQLRAALAN